MNCAMMTGMTTYVKDEFSLFIHQVSENDVLHLPYSLHKYIAHPMKSFIHQMIPHHQNAVNMAKGKQN